MVKRCQWGMCRSDSRYPGKYPVLFIPFPKPKTRLADCMAWIKAVPDKSMWSPAQPAVSQEHRQAQICVLKGNIIYDNLISLIELFFVLLYFSVLQTYRPRSRN